jgi:hypothetical protein
MAATFSLRCTEHRLNSTLSTISHWHADDERMGRRAFDTPGQSSGDLWR